VAGAICEPGVVATVVIHGFDENGSTDDGKVGLDISYDLAEDMASLLDVPTGLTQPAVPNQITATEYYGDRYPDYYLDADKDEVDDITDDYDGGIPRYAAIVAKFCRQVMKRSGARQVNVVGFSMGALIGRWMIENDYDHLASQGKIARFVTVSGVVCGNWACAESGSLVDYIRDEYDDLEAIDVEHMDYDWIEDNLHDPRTEMDNPLYAGIQVMHWASTDDDKYSHALTVASDEPNDGVQLCEDMSFQDVTSRSKFNNQRPTLSHMDATHDTAKEHQGMRAGLVAGLTSTRRVRVTLVDAKVKDMPESGEGEVVFGCRINSPLANTRYGITKPINRIDHQGHTIDPEEMDEDERVTLDQVIFDDFVLPGEQSLTIDFDLREIDYDPFYGIYEDPFGDETESIGSEDMTISTLATADYTHDNDEWNGHIRVETIEYPSFEATSSVKEWCEYQ
jgi:pimeloyl-ACP methyl ester carboxylesterase